MTEGSAEMLSPCVCALQVWHLDINVTILEHGGNLTDACLLSAVAALMVFRRPEVEVAGGDSEAGGSRISMLSPAVREPLPLSLHQLPLSATFGIFGVMSACLNGMFGSHDCCPVKGRHRNICTIS